MQKKNLAKAPYLPRRGNANRAKKQDRNLSVHPKHLCAEVLQIKLERDHDSSVATKVIKVYEKNHVSLKNVKKHNKATKEEHKIMIYTLFIY